MEVAISSSERFLYPAESFNFYCVNFHDLIEPKNVLIISYFVYHHHQRLATKPPTDGAARFAARFLRISYGISGHF